MKEIYNEELFEGFGLIAYSLAKADGEVQPTEKREFYKILDRFYKNISPDFYVGQISFYMSKEYDESTEETYRRGIEKIQKQAKDLSPELVKMFEDTLVKIAEAFPPVEASEREILNRFKKDISEIMKSQ